MQGSGLTNFYLGLKVLIDILVKNQDKSPVRTLTHKYSFMWVCAHISKNINF